MAASSASVAARALEQYYQAENDGVADAYIERSLHRGVPVAQTETCRLPTGALSSRPTVLTNPPLSASAIRQRGALVAALGAYLSTLAAAAGGSTTDDAMSASLATLKSRTVALQKAANEHNRGDLFIEDGSTELSKAVDRLDEDQRNVQQMTQQLVQTDAIVRHLTAIAAADVARQRIDTIDATTLAYNIRRSRLADRRNSGAPMNTPRPPFCSEPAIFERSNYQNDDATKASSSDPSDVRLRNRMDAARVADPDSVLRAIVALDDDEMRLLENPGDAENAAKARAAREELEHAATVFAQHRAALASARQLSHHRRESRRDEDLSQDRSTTWRPR